MRHPPPSTRTVLVALGDAAAASALAAAAAGLGWNAGGPFTALTQALDYLQDDRPDFAVVGTVLSDGTAIPLVSALRRMGVPFLLVSGYEPGSDRLHALERYGEGWVDAPLAELLTVPVEDQRMMPGPARARPIVPAG